MQIIKEFTRQQQELQKKDLEITELKQKVAEHMLRRGEGDCAIQEQLRKKLLEKEKILEVIISKRDSKIERLHGHLTALESDNLSYRAECDTLKIKNEAQSEELRDQLRKLTQQINELRQTVEDLTEETSNAENMKKKLVILLLF